MNLLGDLYAMMDRAKLTGANFLQSTVGMTKLVNSCRSALTTELQLYIERREREAFERGYQQGKNERDKLWPEE